MESLAPTLELAIHVRFDLQQGKGLRDSLETYCESKRCALSGFLRFWLAKQFKGENLELPKVSTDYRKALFELFELGLSGVSILNRLKNLERDMIYECQRNVDEMAAKLPYKGLMPLMLLMFPSLLILIFSPIIEEFLRAIG